MVKKFFKGLYQIACALLGAALDKIAGPQIFGDKWTDTIFWVFMICAVIILISIPFDMLSKQEE